MEAMHAAAAAPPRCHGDLSRAFSTMSSTSAAELQDQQRLLRLHRLLGDSMDAGMNFYKEPDSYSLQDELRQRSWELPDPAKMLRRQNASTMDSDPTATASWNDGGATMDDVFLSEDQIDKARALKKTASDASEGKMSSVSKERSPSNDSILDRDSDYSSSISTQLVAELEQQIISAKCELAVMMNKEACFKTLLEHRDSLILELDTKCKELEKEKGDKKSLDKRMKEQVRQLQNQNRFLNEEVKKLAKLQYLQQDKFVIQEQRLHDVDNEMERWKRDYLYVLQSTISVPSGDIVDGMEVSLYGGNVHKERIKELLEEARMTNPGLPTYERLALSTIHIDQYGFKHTYKDEGLLIHYISTQLVQHYNGRLDSVVQHHRRWREMLRENNGLPGLNKTKELKLLCRRGIPAQCRREAWRKLIYTQCADVINEKGPHYFMHLVNMTYDSQYVSHNRKQISLDLLRTMPSNVNFDTKTTQGVEQMKEILQAFCLHNPDVGYCQGMNFIVGMTLLFLDAEDAFWAVIAITEKYFASNYFDNNLSGAQADQEVLKDLMKEKLPNLYQHLDDLDIEISTVTLNWFLAVFFDAVPFETLLRIWDCFLMEGPKVLFRFSLAVLKIHENGILQKRDTISIMRHLKCCAKLTYDADGLIKVAFDQLRPFPRRQDIAAKQVVYLNALREKMRKREIYRKAYTEKDQMLRELDLAPSSALVYECAIPCGPSIWIAYGSQTTGRISVLNAAENLMFDLDVQLDSRIMCACNVENEVVLLGTLSWDLHAFSVNSRHELWCVQLHDSILCATCHVGDKRNRLFCGLADGTIAVLEQIQPCEPRDDPLYIPVGRCPVTSLLLVDNCFLWAACGNMIHVLNSETLDTVEKFPVSSNTFDHIQSLSESIDGVWVSIKGSSIIELWDPDAFTPKIMFDVKTNSHVTQRKDEDSQVNLARITSVLAFESSLWIGTGGGNLIMYDVLDSSEMATRGQQPPGGMLGLWGSPKVTGDYLETDKLMEKVHELYFERMREENETNNCSSEVHHLEPPPRNVHNGENKTAKTKRSKQMRKQESHEETKERVLDQLHHNKVKSIDVDSGSIDMVDMSNYKSSTDSFGDKTSLSSFENISLSSYDGSFGGGSSSTVATPILKVKGTKVKHKKISELKRDKLSTSSSISDDEEVRMSLKRRNSLKSRRSSSDGSHSTVVPAVRATVDDRETLEESGEMMSSTSHSNGHVETVEEKGKDEEEQDAQEEEVKKVEAADGGNDNYHKLPDVLKLAYRKQTLPPQETFVMGRTVLSTMDPYAHCLSPLVEGGSDSYQSDVQSDGGLGKDVRPRSQASRTKFDFELPQSEASVLQGRNQVGNGITPLNEAGPMGSLPKSKTPALSTIIEATVERASSSAFSSTEISDYGSLSSNVPQQQQQQRSSSESYSSHNGHASQEERHRQFSGEDINDGIISNGHEEEDEPHLTLQVPSLLETSAFPHCPNNTPSCHTKPDGNFSFFQPSSPDGGVSTPSPKASRRDKMRTGNKMAASLGGGGGAGAGGASSSGAGRRGRHSRTPSNCSMCSTGEPMYTCDLYLQARVKISDRPIRCLLPTSFKDEPMLVSCAGCHGDDEAVLKWRKEPNEKLWTNEPVLDVCPLTNSPRKPFYMLARSRSSSME